MDYGGDAAGGECGGPRSSLISLRRSRGKGVDAADFERAQYCGDLWVVCEFGDDPWLVRQAS